MNRSVRSVATALAVGFTIYFAARAVWWTVQPSAPLLMVGAILLYLAVVITAVLIEPPGGGARMPAWWGIVAVVASIIVPVMINAALLPAHRTEPFATWYIGGIGVLSVVCIARRRPVMGWLVLVVLTVVSAAFLGPFVALKLGLVGSITWAVVAQLLVLFWDRAVRDTAHLAEIQRAVSAWHATQTVRQRERRVRVQYALAAAGPVLARTVASHGLLTDAERHDARMAEGRLRDELRGASLLNDSVRSAIRDARLRGIAVTVFDEGGLDELGEQRRGEIRDELAEVLTRAAVERIIIRAARNPHAAVTVVGRTGAGDSSDEDAVGLWHVIPRQREAEAAQ